MGWNTGRVSPFRTASMRARKAWSDAMPGSRTSATNSSSPARQAVTFDISHAVATIVATKSARPARRVASAALKTCGAPAVIFRTPTARPSRRSGTHSSDSAPTRAHIAPSTRGSVRASSQRSVDPVTMDSPERLPRLRRSLKRA